MRRIQYWTLLAVILLVCASFFTTQHNGLSDRIVFEVDGVKYWVRRYADIDRKGRVATSSLVVHLHSERGPSDSSNYSSQRGTTITTWNVGGKKVVVKTDTLYFFREGKIVLETKYQDLDIDAQRLNADLEEVRDYLYPILEKLIRENVPPQEPETEEEP